MKNNASDIKQYIAQKIRSEIEKQGITKTELRKRMKTGEAALYRLLNKDYTSMTLDSLIRACNSLDLKINISLDNIDK